MTGRPWPLGDADAARAHHRAVHIFSTRWCRRTAGDDGRDDERPAPWAEADELRAIAFDDPGCSLAEAFRGIHHLERQYSRVAERMPSLIGAPLRVEVPHRFSHGIAEVPGDLLLLRLPSGQLVVCLSLEFEARLRELPEALIFALHQGPDLAMRVCGSDAVEGAVTTFESAVDMALCTVPGLAQATEGDGSPRLLLASELHTMLFVRAGDRTALEDDELVRRLLGRVADDVETLEDPAIARPGEFNRFAGTLGAVRPGASLLAGQSEPVCRNAFMSAVLLMGSASLLREARDEAYAVLGLVNDRLKQPRHRWSIRGHVPYEDEAARLAVLTIAVAFHVETHLDIRRVVSDAYLSDFHQSLAAALAIPRSVEATTKVMMRLEAAIAAAGQRNLARNALVLPLAAGVAIGLATLLVDVLQ